MIKVNIFTLSPPLYRHFVYMFMAFLFVGQLSAQTPENPILGEHDPVSVGKEPTDPEAWTKSTCDESMRRRISTHPDKPENTQRPARLNTFDWRLESMPVVSPLFDGDVDMPNYQDNNPAMAPFTLLSGIDNKPEDGWELIAKDFGGMLSNQNPSSTRQVQNPFFILYNRYQNRLRVFVSRGKVQNTSMMLVTLFHLDKNKSALLDIHSGSGKPLDLPYVDKGITVAALSYDAAEKWFYADFVMMYDPCVCFYGSNRIAIDIKAVETSTVELDATFQGSLVAGPNRVYSPNGTPISFRQDYRLQNNIPYDYKGAFVKTYTSFNTFLKENKDINTNLGAIGDNNIFNSGFKNLGKTLSEFKLIKAGFNFTPYLKFGLAIFDLFGGTGGGTAPPQKVEIMPMTLRGQLELTGTITTKSNYDGMQFGTPGSSPTDYSNADYPHYNEALGIFNLLETPIIAGNYTPNVTYSSTMEDSHYYDLDLELKLARPIKYVVNPASGLEIQEAYASIILEGIWDTYSITSTNGNQLDKILMSEPVELYTENPTITINANGAFTTYSDSPKLLTENNIRLRVILNMRRKDGLGENVPLVFTYPVKLGQSIEGIKPYLKEVSTNDVRTFCQSATYKNNRIFTKNAPITTINPVFEKTMDLSVFPNPANDVVKVNYKIEEESQVIKAYLTDLTGKTVSQVFENEVTKGEYGLTFPTQNLAAGMYILVFESGTERTMKKIVISH